MGVLGQVGAKTPAAGAAPGAERADHTVLVVEDDTNLRGLIETLLRRAGYEVLAAADAATARAHMRAFSTDLVIMDLSLPDDDGFTLLGQLAYVPVTRAVPVLIVSAYSGSDWQARSSAMGAAGFIGKPFDSRELVGTVDRILQEAHRLRQAG